MPQPLIALARIAGLTLLLAVSCAPVRADPGAPPPPVPAPQISPN